MAKRETGGPRKMRKVNRTFRLDSDLSKALDKICVRYGDKTYHVENALRVYIASLEAEERAVMVRGDEK